MNERMEIESPVPGNTRRLAPEAVQLLQRIHALAAAGTAITHDLADSAWPPATITLWRQDLRRLEQRGTAAERQAHERGVPRALVAIAWYAGHCDTEWTPLHDDPTAGLRRVLGAELMSNAGQLHNMAAVLVSHELQPGSRLPRDLVKANQLTRNMAAMFKQAAMLSNLIGASDPGWDALWDLPQIAQQRYLTPFLGPEAQQDLEWAWNQYTASDVETTVLHTIEQLERRTTDLRPRDESNPLGERGVEHAKAAAARTYKNAARQLHELLGTDTDTGTGGAVDAALPQESDRSWEPRDNTPGPADRAEDPAPPEVEP